MIKKEAILLISITILLLSSTIASATGDVAYIYRRQFKIDDNIINSFENVGLSVDLIQEQNLPRDLSQYKLLFIGDENFRNENQIPINNFPSITTNSHHTDTWGLTDRDGVSQLASTAPLTVRKDGRTIKVYTIARESRGGIALPYYFLDKKNKAPELTTIASTKATSSGINFGDVISYANPGIRMFNGKIQQEKMCFFGIIKSDFWTSKAKDLFKECIGFVASECSSNLDCPDPELTGAPFCDNGDVHQNEKSFTCQKENVIKQCTASDNSIQTEACEFGCFDGKCKEGPHDVSLIDFENSINKIRIKTQNGTTILDSELMCNEKYEIFIVVENTGVHTENVTFEGSVSNISITHKKITNFSPGKTTNPKKKTINFSLEEGLYNITIEAIIPKDDNPEDNIAKREIFVSCPVPVIKCFNDEECNDDNEETKDICRNAGTEKSFCENKEISTLSTCSTDGDCGSTTTLSELFCSINDINQLVRTFTCNNPGTEESFCESNIESQTIKTCSNFCSQGECISITCLTHSDCNDDKTTTIDICNNPGTEESFCTNNPIDVVCSSDSDCGINGFFDNVCLNNDVTSLSQTFTCFLPGTPQSFCSSTTTQDLKETCSSNEICSAGLCVPQGECTPGQTRSCGVSNAGQCRLGTQTCQANGFFSSCIGAINPTTEICDAKDNNCNGQIDENNVCGSPPCTNQCSEGARQCISNGFRVCRDFNGDGCTEWSNPVDCGFGRTCNAGQCIPIATD